MTPALPKKESSFVMNASPSEKMALSMLLPDGRTVKPPGWVWVLGMALAGVPWAIQEVEEPDFKARVKEWMREQHRLRAEQAIVELEERIESIRKQMP